jgi:hypothetical protein
MQVVNQPGKEDPEGVERELGDIDVARDSAGHGITSTS